MNNRNTPVRAAAWRRLAPLMLAGIVSTAAVADKDDDKRSLNREWVEDLRKGKIKLEGDHAAVDTLILGRNIPIPYDYIATLMRTPNAFGQGPACIVCHASTNPKTSYRGLDLSTCEGIKAGTTEEPAHPIFTPGKPARKSVLGRRLRNNRMPLGAPFSMTSDTPAYETVREWIVSGASNDENFKKNVLPLFKKKNVFAPNTPSCTTCHMSNKEPPSFHELNLGSYEGIMLGADSVAKGVANATR